MIDELIQKQVEEYNKVGMCDCECHTSSSSDEDMKINGCDLCYENSEFAPRHPDKRNLFVQSMKKVAESMIDRILSKTNKVLLDIDDLVKEWPSDSPAYFFMKKFRQTIKDNYYEELKIINSLTSKQEEKV